MIWALLSLALAGEAPPALDAFEAWATKARDELVLDGQRPYRVVIGAQDRLRYTVSAEFGSLFAEGEERARPGLVEVVVGDPQLDSSRFSARNSSSGAARNHPAFVVEDVPLAIERDLWLTTDDSFKTAVQRFQQKAAALAQLPTAWPADWTPVEPVTSVRRAERRPFDRDALRELAVAGSAAFRGVEGLRNGWVELVVEQGEAQIVTSEGVRVVEPEERVMLYAWCDVVRADGVQVFEELQHIAVDPSGLLSVDVLRAELHEMGTRVAQRAAAPVVDYYEGPVVFEGTAASQMFAWLVSAELEGTPPDPRPGATWEQLVRGGPRIGRRLLPAGWDVVDDPTAFPPGLPGGYAYDREGVRAERVELVRDGYVVDLAMSRVPRPERPPPTATPAARCRGSGRASCRAGRSRRRVTSRTAPSTGRWTRRGGPRAPSASSSCAPSSAVDRAASRAPPTPCGVTPTGTRSRCSRCSSRPRTAARSRTSSRWAAGSLFGPTSRPTPAAAPTAQPGACRRSCAAPRVCWWMTSSSPSQDRTDRQIPTRCRRFDSSFGLRWDRGPLRGLSTCYRGEQAWRCPHGWAVFNGLARRERRSSSVRRKGRRSGLVDASMSWVGGGWSWVGSCPMRMISSTRSSMMSRARARPRPSAT